MNRFKTLLAAAMVLLASGTSFAQTYTPSQGNLDSRKEFVRERFGIFLPGESMLPMARANGISRQANSTRMNMQRRQVVSILQPTMLPSG